MEQKTVTLRELLEAGVHFGHQTKRWNPKMKPYIFGARNKIHIINLEKTLPLFQNALKLVEETVAQGGSVLFVGTKKQAQTVIKEEANRSSMYYVVHRWLGGTLTNFSTIKTSIAKLKSFENMKIDGTFEKITKKERLSIEKKRQKLELNLGGIKDMETLPSLMFVVDPGKEKIAINEAKNLNIPIIAVTDTNCDPDPIDYIVPGNDDAIRSIRLFASYVANAVLRGKELAQERKIAHQDKPEYEEEVQQSKEDSGEGTPDVVVASEVTIPIEPEGSASPEK